MKQAGSTGTNASKCQRWLLDQSVEGMSLVAVLSERLQITKSAAKRLLDKRVVFINRKRVWLGKYRLQEGDLLEVHLRDELTPSENLKILYQDEYCLVVDKPAYSLSNDPSLKQTSVETILQKQLNTKALRAVHRLDRQTSGCLLFARTPMAWQELKNLFLKQKISKTYLAILQNVIAPPQGEIMRPIAGKRAITRYKILSQARKVCLVKVCTETGRMHQIRIHFAELGYPILGEIDYQRLSVKNASFRGIPRQMLHAWKLSFQPPWIDHRIEVTAALAADFQNTMITFNLIL